MALVWSLPSDMLIRRNNEKMGLKISVSLLNEISNIPINVAITFEFMARTLVQCAF